MQHTKDATRDSTQAQQRSTRQKSAAQTWPGQPFWLLSVGRCARARRQADATAGALHKGRRSTRGCRPAPPRGRQEGQILRLQDVGALSAALLSSSSLVGTYCNGLRRPFHPASNGRADGERVRMRRCQAMLPAQGRRRRGGQSAPQSRRPGRRSSRQPKRGPCQSTEAERSALDRRYRRPAAEHRAARGHTRKGHRANGPLTRSVFI